MVGDAGRMTSVSLRAADVHDAEDIAGLHADSWRRHYRGAYADSYLDGGVVAEREALWSARLAAPAGTATTVAILDGTLVGFIHVVLDHHPTWGSLIDNLHVRHDLHRSGVGTRLLASAARAVTSGALYLWVLEQNVAAQRFYLAHGATRAGTAVVSPPGGNPTHLNGTPHKQRMTWPDTTHLSNLPR